MGTDSLTPEQIARAQAEELKMLRTTVQRLTERLGPDPDAQPAATPGFPRVVYRAQDEIDPKQIDHPGWDAKTVGDQHALDDALAEGWAREHGPFVYQEPAKPAKAAKAEPVAAKPAKAAK